MIKDLVKDLLKYAPASIITAFVGLFSVPVLTRIIPPADYGNYILVVSTISVLSIMVGWLSVSVIRFYPGYERDGRLNELSNIIVGWLLITVTVVAICYIGALFVTKAAIGTQLYRMMVIGAVVFVLGSTFDVLLNFLRSKRLVGSYTFFSAWRSIVGLGIGIVLVARFGFGVDGLLWGYAVSLAFALPPIWKLTIGKFPRINSPSIDFTKEMARYGLPLVAANLANWILSVSDRYVLEFFRGAHEVGIYSVSYAVSEQSILLLASLFMLASGPISINLWETRGRQSAGNFISSLTRYYLLLCVPATIGLSVLAEPIIAVLAGAEYREGYRIIPFVALSGFLLGLQQRFQSGLIFYRRTVFILIAVIIAGMINISLNLLFVPLYGYMAAAITTLISYIIFLMIIVIISRRLFIWIFPFESLGRSVLSSSAMAIIIYPVGKSLTSYHFLNLAAAVFLGFVSYITFLYLLGEIQQNEKKALKDAFASILRNLNLMRRWRETGKATGRQGRR